MRSLPHITIACSAIWASSRLLGPNRRGRALAKSSGGVDSAENGQTMRPSEIDYRLGALGSLLPDTVDRIQRAVFRLRRARPDPPLLGGTLLMHIPLLLAGIYLWRDYPRGSRR